jgi:cyclopropane-fatty-acyl-phospholipid synthase
MDLTSATTGIETTGTPRDVWSTTAMAAETKTRRGVAADLVGLAERALGTTLPVRVRAWDGSEAGPAPGPDVPVLLIRSRRALRHLAWSPGELGLARAYVTGELDLEGDLTETLHLVGRAVRDRPPTPAQSRREQIATRLGALRTAARLGAIGPRPPRPASESKLAGRQHTTSRDQAAISHHYDLSNAFYELLLDPNMAYSSAYWPSDDPAYPLEDAQRDKLDLVCTKLGLHHGSSLLDVGCGWGSLALHAAEHYGANVVGVTLSVEQRDFVRARAAERGVADRVEIRLQHYRDVPDTGFDAVSSIEMGEHVGDREYVDFAAMLFGFLRPQGRLLVQQMSRNGAAPGGGPFIETYIAPDMHMKPLATTIGLLEGAGLEIRGVQAMREHYPRTIRAWLATLDDRWADAVAIVGLEVARVWRLYLAGAALAFDENRMGVDQILAVRPDAAGLSGMPA